MSLPSVTCFGHVIIPLITKDQWLSVPRNCWLCVKLEFRGAKVMFKITRSPGRRLPWWPAEQYQVRARKFSHTHLSLVRQKGCWQTRKRETIWQEEGRLTSHWVNEAWRAPEPSVLWSSLIGWSASPPALRHIRQKMKMNNSTFRTLGMWFTIKVKASNIATPRCLTWQSNE